MKLLNLIFILVLSSSVYSQTVLLGYTLDYTTDVLEGSDLSITKDSSGIKHLIYSNADCIIVTDFKDDLSFAATLIPTSDAKFKSLVERFNENYVIVSDKHWKYYSKNDVINIKIVYSETTKSHAFLYTY